MDEQKVSVIVAIYNVEKYLEKCLDSILMQDYSNMEIILVDDCSTDKSGDICDRYSAIDDRVRVIHRIENNGQFAVRNDGMDCSSGEYIVFVDGDDWLAKNCISYLLEIISYENADFGINLLNYTTRDTKQSNNSFKICRWTQEKATAELLYPKISIGVWNKIYRRDFLEKNNLRFKPLFTSEGFRFITDVSQRAQRISVGSRKVYYYRLNNHESATTKYDIRQSLVAIRVSEDIKKDLIIKTKGVSEAADHQIWTNHFWNIRQMVALRNKDEYLVEYKKSIKYLRTNAIRNALIEQSFSARVKSILCGICPTLVAWIINYKIQKELKKDVTS
ncbi:glycosyltransferase [Candidatus Saccharibacteria bacterium]|nr:glycosyltransferase [Candidatus Saccharibacteria bacterium]